MPTYKIEAMREIHYEFEIEANSEEEAVKEMERRELVENIEDYAYDWYPLEVTDVSEEE